MTTSRIKRGACKLHNWASMSYWDYCPYCNENPQTGHDVFHAPASQTAEITGASGVLPTDAKARKDAPMDRGLLRYFPRALAYVAEVSRVSNERHNPGEPIHWAREKSADHGDCIVRHQCEAGTLDTDGLRHSGKVAWRALAQLEIELEAATASALPGHD